ncbi:Haloacid dehalogenase-like hydrolase-domain-containing protein [Poronia punctata]|nr:Haloacid dehalogenase-like hydrolase-domain-containing protein [Poronia punctata]
MQIATPPPAAIIFDLGEVVFSWSSSTTPKLPKPILRSIMKSATWATYERGQITRQHCFELVARQLSVSVEDVSLSFAQVRQTLNVNPGVLSFLQDMKKQQKQKNKNKTKIYAMSNIGREDFADIAQSMDWTLFQHVFTSAEAGARKPDSASYEYVLKEIGLQGKGMGDVVFIDDKEVNVRAAEEVGIKGLVFGDETVDILRSMVEGRGDVDDVDEENKEGWWNQSESESHLFQTTRGREIRSQ